MVIRKLYHVLPTWRKALSGIVSRVPCNCHDDEHKGPILCEPHP